MMTTEELFAAKSEWASFHDAMFEVDQKARTPEELRVIFDSLPVSVRDIAHCWGLSDTVFRDEAYTVMIRRLNFSGPRVEVEHDL